MKKYLLVISGIIIFIAIIAMNKSIVLEVDNKAVANKVYGGEVKLLPMGSK